MKVLVLGAGGFIGSHLTRYLEGKGRDVYGADIKTPEYAAYNFNKFILTDLRDDRQVRALFGEIQPQEVYHLAADMGGIGYITSKLAEITRNNTLIDVNVIHEASTQALVERFFYASSACAYPVTHQEGDYAFAMERTGILEEDAWPAMPEAGYGLEKLYAEKLCEYYFKDAGLEVRVARFHNAMGPKGTWDGGKEKAPAALCRKVAMAKDGGSISVWGDGKQGRSFIYIDDLCEGIWKLTQSSYVHPLNLGSDRMVTIEELAKMIIKISGKNLTIEYDPTGPRGVFARNSNNEKSFQVLDGWEPKTSLEIGLAETYRWIKEQVNLKGGE